MKNLIKKFKKLDVTPVTGKKPETETEEKWMDTARVVEQRIGMRPTKVETNITSPQVLKPLVELAPKGEVPALLMKTVQDIDKDRIMGKRLALNVVQTKGLINPINSGPARELTEALPVTTSTVKRNKNAPRTVPGIEMEESRPFTQSELNDLRKEHAQNGATDAEYMLRLWEKGADTIMLTDAEMSRLKGCIENPGVYDALDHVLQVGRGDTHPLLDWITAAWRLAYPTLDLTQFETAGQWDSYDKVIRVLRKLGMIYCIYNAVSTPQAAPLLPSFRRIIVKGAPNNIKMTIAGPLSNCATIADAINYFKEFRELQQEKVVSLNVQGKIKARDRNVTQRRPFKAFRSFRPLRQFGNPRTLYKPQPPRGPWNRVFGTPRPTPLKRDERRPGGGPIRRNTPFLGSRPPYRTQGGGPRPYPRMSNIRPKAWKPKL